MGVLCGHSSAVEHQLPNRNFHNLGLEPNVAFEVRQLWTALGLVAAGVGIALVPSSVRRLGREDVEYLKLDEPEISSPIIISCRTNDGSPLLAHMIKLMDGSTSGLRPTYPRQGVRAP